MPYPSDKFIETHEQVSGIRDVIAENGNSAIAIWNAAIRRLPLAQWQIDLCRLSLVHAQLAAAPTR